jgi:hypothetical protein
MVDVTMSTISNRAPVRLALDYQHKRAEVELASGLVVASPLTGRAAEHDGAIDRTDYRPAASELLITFHWGETVIFEVGPVETPGVPVVYLDQNHWVMLARLQWSPGKVPAPNRDGYAQLTALARERAIVLPLSGAHAVETGRTDRRWRRDLATTMLQLSRGWQMRSASKVRREELVCAVAGSDSPIRPRSVFTLDPDALFSASDYAEGSSAPGDLHARLTWACTLAEVLIDDEREHDEHVRAKAERWAATYAELGTRLGEANASREEKSTAAQMALVSDFTDDLVHAAAVAGRDRQEMEDWLGTSEGSIGAMPAIGRIQEVTRRRLSNPLHPWRVNDLNDLHFLSTAAGYADFMLAEKATSHDLRCAERRVPSGARICGSPGELVELIERQR